MSFAWQRCIVLAKILLVEDGKSFAKLVIDLRWKSYRRD